MGRPLNITTYRFNMALSIQKMLNLLQIHTLEVTTNLMNAHRKFTRGQYGKHMDTNQRKSKDNCIAVIIIVVPGMCLRVI